MCGALTGTTHVQVALSRRPSARAVGVPGRLDRKVQQAFQRPRMPCREERAPPNDARGAHAPRTRPPPHRRTPREARTAPAPAPGGISPASPPTPPQHPHRNLEEVRREKRRRGKRDALWHTHRRAHPRLARRHNAIHESRGDEKCRNLAEVRREKRRRGKRDALLAHASARAPSARETTQRDT